MTNELAKRNILVATAQKVEAIATLQGELDALVFEYEKLTRHERTRTRIGQAMTTQNPLVKPVAKPIGSAIYWKEAEAYINALTGRDIRDWQDTHGCFDKWCEKRNLPQVDREGNPRDHSQVLFSAYQADPELPTDGRGFRLRRPGFGAARQLH